MPNESFVKYIHAGSLDKEWGLFLTGAGYAQIPPTTVYPPNVHPSGYFFTWEKGRVLQEYQINYITEGSGTFETSTDQFQVVPGSILILRPGMWHRYKPIPIPVGANITLDLTAIFAQTCLTKDFSNRASLSCI